MALHLENYETHTKNAVAHYWSTLLKQSKRQTSGGADRGNRSAVTGGKQMDGFCELLHWLLTTNGMDAASIYYKSKLDLPGFYRPTKAWDLVVVHEGHLVAALEFKSQRGPSFGNNFNNRTEEAIGNATDIWTAFREGAFGLDHPRPWLAWLMLLEDCPKSGNPVRVTEPHFDVFPEFKQTSYAARYEILARKLVLEKQYDAASLLLSAAKSGPSGTYSEPASDLGIQKFLASLAGHVATCLAAS